MSKNVVWWPAMKNKDLTDKYGGYDYFEHSRKTWEYWCKKNDVLFVPFEDPVKNDLFRFRPNWQKTIFVFDELERMGIDYDQVALMDSSTMIKWNAPNFFNMTDHKFTAWRDADNLKWIYDSVQGYKKFFNGFELDLSRYFSSGLIIFNKTHKKLFKDFKNFYFENIDELIKLQDKTVKKGTEQTPLNYFIQMNDVEINMDLPIAFKLTHINRKEMFSHNWQLKEDTTPFFVKYGYIWVLNGIPKDQRTNLMKQTWNLVKNHYVDDDEILNSVLHKDTAKFTTSRKFKKDLIDTFSDEKYKKMNVLELGCSQGMTTKIFSHLFNKVYAVDIDEFNVQKTAEVCSGMTNVHIKKMDVRDEWDFPDMDVVMIDAGHTPELLSEEINRVVEYFNNPIIIIDDYGNPKQNLKSVVDSKLNIDKFIGENPGFVTANDIMFNNREGVICNLKKS
jgi:hypothetical protein